MVWNKNNFSLKGYCFAYKLQLRKDFVDMIAINRLPNMSAIYVHVYYFTCYGYTPFCSDLSHTISTGTLPHAEMFSGSPVLYAPHFLAFDFDFFEHYD